MLGLGLSLTDIPVLRSGGGSGGAILPPNPAPSPVIENSATGPSYYDTGSLSHFAQTSGSGGGQKVGANVVDSNNMLFLQANNGDNGFFLYQRVAGVDGFIGFYSMDGGAIITSGTGRLIELERLEFNEDDEPILNRITMTVGATVKVQEVGPLGIANVERAGLYAGTAPVLTVGALSSPLLILSAAYNPVADAIDTHITYSGTPDYYEYTLDGVEPAAAAINQTVYGPGDALIRVPVTAEMRGSTQTLELVQHNDTDVSDSIDVSIPAETLVGINESAGTTFPFLEVGPQVSFFNPDAVGYPPILHRTEVPEPGYSHVPVSADGSVGFKRDLDGTLYAANAVGATRVAIEFRFYIPPSEAGTYTFSLIPGADCSRPGDTLTYNSVTGIGEIDFGVGQNVVLLESTLATWGSSGVQVTCHKKGTSPTEYDLSDAYVEHTQPLGSILRMLNPAGVNNTQMPGRTSTTLPQRTLATRAVGWANQEDIEHQVARVNGLGTALWYQPTHIDDDTIITYSLNLMATTSLIPLAYIEWSNELFNDRFKQTDDTILTAVRLGYAPDGATPGGLTPETILDGVDRTLSPRWVTPVDATHAQINRAFSTNDKFLVEYSGYKVYKALGNLTSGTSFAIAGDSNVQLLYDNGKTRQAQARYTATRTKQIATIAAAEYGAEGRPTPKIVIGGAFSQGYSWSQQSLHWDNAGAVIDYIALGVYYGGGTAGLDLGPYSSTSVSGWGPTEKDQLWVGTVAAGVAAAKDSYFLVTPGVITTTMAVLADFVTDLDADATAEGWPTKVCAYEGQSHAIFSGFPDKAYAYDTGSGYGLNSFVVGSDGKTYRAKGSVPAATAPPNATYWDVYWDAAQTTSFVAEQRSETLFAAIQEDERYGRDLLQYANAWKEISGNPLVLYERVSVISSQQGSWGLSRNENDMDLSGPTINYRYKAVVDFVADL